MSAQMKAISAGARVIEAPVFKKAGSGLMPGLSAKLKPEHISQCSYRGRRSTLLLLRMGPGAQAGAPAVSELGDYYSRDASRASIASIASGTVQLWTTTETFQSALAGTESANGWQPAPVSRIRQQIAAEAPYVSQVIQFMYGWDMSPKRLTLQWKPICFSRNIVETLLVRYCPAPDGNVSYSISPSLSYADDVPSKLTNGTGGGFGSRSRRLGGVRGRRHGSRYSDRRPGRSEELHGCPDALCGIDRVGDLFPARRCGGVLRRWRGFVVSRLAAQTGQNVGVDTPLLYAVGWVNATNSTPVIASQVRVTVNFYEWLFIGEIKVMGS